MTDYLTPSLSYAVERDELAGAFPTIPRLAGAEQVALCGGDPPSAPEPLKPARWAEMCVLLAAVVVEQGGRLDDVQRALIQADTLGELGYALRLLSMPDAALSSSELRVKRGLQHLDAPNDEPDRPTTTLRQLLGFEPLPDTTKETPMIEPDLGPPACSLCGGKWLHDILHQHRVDCARYAAELSPRAADHRGGWQRALRAATASELDIISEHGYEAPGPDEEYRIQVESTPIYRRRVLIASGPKGRVRAAERITNTTTAEGDTDE